MYADSVGSCHALDSLAFPTRIGTCMRLPHAGTLRLVEAAVPGDIIDVDTRTPPDLQTLRLGVLRASSERSLPKSWAATSITTPEVDRLERARHCRVRALRCGTRAMSSTADRAAYRRRHRVRRRTGRVALEPVFCSVRAAAAR